MMLIKTNARQQEYMTMTLVEQMDRLARSDGLHETLIPGVRIYKSSKSKAREPLIYDKGVIIVVQGAKRIYLDNRVYDYNPDNYLVMALPIAAECEVHASQDEPLFSLMVDIDMNTLYTIIEQMDTFLELDRSSLREKQHGLYLSPVTKEIRDTVLRLLAALQSPLESKVIGQKVVEELIFRIMCSENACLLYMLAMKNSNLSRVDKALKQIHEDYYKSMNVESLATLVNMSPSSFHRAFREATASSPIQYIKKIRLNKARGLLENQGLRVNEAAIQVGYESPAQFSREFKRYFGNSPVSVIGERAGTL